LNEQNLVNLISKFSGLRVLVIGEAMLDAYIHGTTDRLCREAPVPVVAIEDREYIPGGAANTAVNAAAMGAKVTFLTSVGQDQEGTRLIKALQERQVPTAYVIREKDRTTLAKNRLVAGEQMVVRFDQGGAETLSAETEKEMIAHLEKLFPESDAVIISDYGYGILTPGVIQAITRLQAADPRVVVVDSKRLVEYKSLDITAVKPNYDEIVSMVGKLKLDGKPSRVENIINNEARILKLTKAQIVAVTLDQDGAVVFEDGRPPYRTYASPRPHTYAAGAGDTFVSALTLSLAAGGHTPAAAEIASAAACIVVHKDGTASCSSEELIDHFSTDEKFVTDAFQLAARMAYYRRQGQKVVFTNGCFDILHRGHITYLNKAKEYGDILVIGLNSDESVRRLKGPDRPINKVEDRGQVLSALSCVDHIIPFHEDTPEEMIKIIKPDIFVKGGDYTLDTLPEAPLVIKLGGEVVILPYVQDQSTTGIIERIKKLYAYRS
jgi:D-beta-D-heptose 7-phosphate kinase / D-beta-D-heptose 1-phosphate adenosyltransferase